MTVYAAPEPFPDHDTAEAGLFLAGGISNCPDWQTWMVEELEHSIPKPLYNPRRNFYPDDPFLAQEQIEWEFKALNTASEVLFWFPKETLCPITLFELGRFSHQKNTPLYVGVHPDYARKFDVETQLRLARPDVNIMYSLEELSEQVKSYYNL